MSNQAVEPNKVLAGLPIEGVDAMALATQIIDAVGEWVQVVQTERTKRAEIDAWERTTLAEIRARRDLLVTYLDRSFDERAANFRELFRALDQAFDQGPEQVAVVLGSITTLAMHSPFSDLKDVATAVDALKDPDHEWSV
jgi:hypothetical protein